MQNSLKSTLVFTIYFCAMVFIWSGNNWLSGVISLDRRLFFAINTGQANGFSDSLMPMVREANLWAPLYLFLFLLVVTNFGRRGWWWSLFFICTAAAGDLLSSRLIKEHIFRLRPCRDPLLVGQIRVLANYCPQSSSFTSSHAVNHFAMAVFIAVTMRPFLKGWTILFFFWAALVAYAQVYVGVHYPLDVASGALIGSLLGYIIGRFFNNYSGLISLEHKRA